MNSRDIPQILIIVNLAFYVIKKIISLKKLLLDHSDKPEESMILPLSMECATGSSFLYVSSILTLHVSINEPRLVMLATKWSYFSCIALKSLKLQSQTGIIYRFGELNLPIF